MRKISQILIPFFVLFQAQSCSTDLDAVADWKETTVVIGLLNQSDSINYFKITKAFLDENTNALELAKVKDSLFFDTERIEAKIFELDGNDSTEIALVPDFSIPKDTGIFAAPEQIVYRLNHFLDEDKDYRLWIKTPNKQIVTGKTDLVHDFRLARPRANSTLDWSDPDGVRVEFASPRNALIYELKVRIHYYDYNKSDTSFIEKQQLDWFVAKNRKFNSSNGNQNIKLRVYGSDLFRVMRNQIPIDPDRLRRFIGVEFIIACGGRDLADYITINGPSTSIVQVRTEFTNIDNGLGLISSRYILPNIIEEEQKATYPISSPTFRAPQFNAGLDSLTKKYPELNFLRF